MDRRLLFPAIAMTAMAQQTPPATAEAEKALRAQVEKFYQLEVDRKFREAEALVAEDSKDDFYNSNKPSFKGFSYTSAAFSEDGTHATVTVKVKTQAFFPGVGAQIFEVPAKSNWVLENGEWRWYFDKEAALKTPFGAMTPGPGAQDGSPAGTLGQAPDLAQLKSQVTISRTEVPLTAADPVQTVTLTNHLPGPVGLDVSSTQMDGVTVEVEKNQLAAGETIGLRFRLTTKARVAGVVSVVCSPINKQFDIQITGN